MSLGLLIDDSSHGREGFLNLIHGYLEACSVARVILLIVGRNIPSNIKFTTVIADLHLSDPAKVRRTVLIGPARLLLVP